MSVQVVRMHLEVLFHDDSMTVIILFCVNRASVVISSV